MGFSIRAAVIVAFFLILPLRTSLSQDSLGVKIDVGVAFSTFQQQVKAKVGDTRGERLVNETSVGLFAAGTYPVMDVIDAGIFLQYDRGNRHAGRFAGFDPVTGKTETSGNIGGDYSEFWFGPFLRGSWKGLFLEGGYGLIGVRTDDARTDLVSATGDSTSTFSVNPTISWYASLGGAVPIFKSVDAVFRLTYRLRYYNERGGQPFPGTMEHGSQNVTPFFGIRWTL